MKSKLLVLSALLTFPLLGFEINTHQAITRCALSNLCGWINDDPMHQKGEFVLMLAGYESSESADEQTVR